MTDEEAMMTLGVITSEAREKTGNTRLLVAAQMGLNYRTLGGLERAETRGLPNPSTLRAVEAYYGWRIGSLQKFWESRRDIAFGTVTVDDFIPEPPPEEVGLIKASHLTDAELMAELSFRFLMRDRREKF